LEERGSDSHPFCSAKWDARARYNPVAILRCVQSLRAIACAMMADIAALRNTMIDDSASTELHRRNLEEALATTKPRVEEAIGSWENLLQKMEVPSTWKK